MKRVLSILAVNIIFLFFMSMSIGQSNDPIPTLVPPTLVPTIASPTIDVLLDTSAVKQIQESGTFRVGIIYNQPPFSELSITGDLHGFDAELATLIAETWETEVEFKQVTRQNALEVLNSGQVDAVLTAFVHYREFDSKVEFTQTYLVSKQAMMVLATSDTTAPTALINRPVGYVVGTLAETVYQKWGEQLGIPVNGRAFLTIDQAFVALAQGEIDGLVASEEELQRVSENHSDLVKILEDAIALEAHAIAIRRQDVNMRNLLNQTLQYLAETDELAPLFNNYFPTKTIPEDALYLYNNLGDEAPKPSNFETNVPYPPQYTAPRVLDSSQLRVAGIVENGENSSEAVVRLNALNRELIGEMANRWGVSVQFISSTPEEGITLVMNGTADIVVGVQPDWHLTSNVDFSSPYLLQGDRLLVPARSEIASFNDLRGQWIATLIGDEGAEAQAKKWADSINAHINFYQTTDADAVATILVENNADVIYGDSLRLLPLLEANPDRLKLTDRWYSRSYYVFAVPRNDLDFHLLVEYTLQELIMDGTLERLSRPLMMSDMMPSFDIWAGSQDYLGLNLAS